MVVELANKFRFEVDSINEIINANKIPSLHLHVNNNIGTLKSSAVLKNFDEKTLSSIKVFATKEDTIPIAVYNEYTHLTHFEKQFSGANGDITIILAADGVTRSDVKAK